MRRPTKSQGRTNRRLVTELYGGEPYEYYPLGKYIVAAPGVCGGMPTFKYTRVDVSTVLRFLAHGSTMEELVVNHEGRIPREAIEEALLIAAQLVNREAA